MAECIYFTHMWCKWCSVLSRQ